MCKCLAGNVACCCFNCALSMLVSIISAFFVVFVIIGLVVYFVYYHKADNDSVAKDLQDGIEKSIDNIRNSIRNR